MSADFHGDYSKQFEYPSNQQEIIYRMSLIFSKSEADSWGTFRVRNIQKLER